MKSTDYSVALSEDERKGIRSMALYWKEVSGREDQSPLRDELRSIIQQLGVSRVLFIIADYAQRAEPAPVKK